MRIPRPIKNLVEALERLPGIGPKTAQRLTFYLLHVPQEELDMLSGAVSKLKTDTSICSVCKNVGEADPCEVCSSPGRDKSRVAVVETPLDVLALERAGYQGIYHVLHGAISPLNNIGPEELFIKELMKRVSDVRSPISEIILATNTNMEGEATAMFIKQELDKAVSDERIADSVKVTRIARGLPIGGDLEYADQRTLGKALEGRSEY